MAILADAAATVIGAAAEEVDVVDEARRLGEPQRLGENIELGARDPQVDALAQGLGLDRLHRLQSRQWRQIADPELEVIAPEPELAHEPLALLALLLAGLCELHVSSASKANSRAWSILLTPPDSPSRLNSSEAASAEALAS
jgi:hypothetical protein